MSRCFSAITIHGISNGMAKLSQNHYRRIKDEIGESYRSEEETRELSLAVRPDETRASLFSRLNKGDNKWIINMQGSLEQTNTGVDVCDDYNDDLID